MLQRCCLLIFLALGLQACGTDKVPEPIGIGTDTDELKKSPCACIEIPQSYQDWHS